MKKFALDYSNLEDQLQEKPRVFKLSEVKDKIKKVAFDVVKFNDSEGLDGLWQIKETEDGEYIVATYDDSELTSESAPESPWKALASADQVHVFFHDTPVAKVTTASVGLPMEEAPQLARHLTDKLASNQKLVKSLLKELSQEEKQELFAKHPELQD